MSDVGTARGVRLIAPAKINLALEVLRKRPDGFHEIDTVMTTIDLADRVTIEPREEGAGIDVSITGEYAAGIDPVVHKSATHLVTTLWPTPGSLLVSELDQMVDKGAIG
ncbi:MAG: hypothetical protein KC472_10370, partial [Dehalococcoidia bacterium]|nr:hypothetical protein [Dehalococcoidia bacterium]